MRRSSSPPPGLDVDSIIDTLWGSFQLHGPNSGVVLGPCEVGLTGSSTPFGRYKSDIPLEPTIEHLCGASRDIFLSEPCLIRLQSPITIAGNIYGEFRQLKAILEQDGPPPLSNYLFLGNYVDIEGLFLHTILLLLAFKIKHPQNVFLLKGDLDHAGIKPNILLVDEVDSVMRSVSSYSLGILNDCLKHLPVAALISDKIICTNSGLSPHLHSLDQIKPPSAVLVDLIGKRSGQHGRFPVGEEAKFLKKNGLRLVCCGNYPAESKCEDFAERRVGYVSSASAFHWRRWDLDLILDNKLHDNELHDNSVIRVDVSLKCSFHNLRYKESSWSCQIGKTTKTQDVCSSVTNPSSGKVGGSKPETNVPYKSEFDPTNLYRSKSPGVKRFLGARV